MLSRLRLRLVIVTLSATCTLTATADEGLWTLDRFPAQKVRSIYGADISDTWLKHVQSSALHLSNGCSASFVSSRGLVLTNNHCVWGCSQEISDAGHDVFNAGFIADEINDEKRCKSLSAEAVLSISDVTSTIAQKTVSLKGATLVRAKEETIGAIEKSACIGDLALRCQVSEFYSGAQYKLFKYKRYEDVRLVFSPGRSLAGSGDSDMPPHKLDVAILRVYEGGAPLPNHEHLRWNSASPRAGELVFVAGSPRLSERELTYSQLKTERDVTLPEEIRLRDELNSRLMRFGEESPAQKQAVQYALSDSVNHTDYIKDLEKALQEQGFLERKQKEETNLRASAGASMETQLSTISKAEKARREQAPARQVFVNGPFFDATSSQLFSYARVLVQGAIEREKPSPTRLPRYSDAQLGETERELLADKTIYLPLERLILGLWLDEAQRNLSPNDSNLAVLLNQRSPSELAEQLSQSRLSDPSLRRQLWEGGMAAIRTSQDPMIQYALRIEPTVRTLQRKWEDTVVEPEAQAAMALDQIRLKKSNGGVYPDANRTLRLSFGKIDGYVDGDTHVGPFTSFGDLFHQSGKADIPSIDPQWTAAKNQLKITTVLNLFSTNDGINGNSGSPLINARGEVIGVFYGGNSYAMAGDYGYDPSLNRALSVSAAAVTQVLAMIFDARNITKELSE